MEPWAWVIGFGVLTAVDLASWRRREGRARWAWTLWIAPACLALYGLGYGLGTVGTANQASALWLAMTALAALGAIPCLVRTARSHGTQRLVAAVNAGALAALAVRVVLFVDSIRLM